MNNKITIPKEIFEQIFFKDGGVKKDLAKSLTGQFQSELPKNSPVKPNAEIEKNEYIKDSNSIRKAIGDTHENGGIETYLEEGAQILSDHLKVGGDFARFIKKTYGIKVQASDTYAKVLDKHLKKIGLFKKTEEFEGIVKKLDKQKREIEDETTLALNQEVLMQMINEIGEDMKPLEKEKEKMFDLLFEAQETSKEKEGTTYMENGGVFSLANKYGISEERLKELIPEYQNGGQQGNPYSLTNSNNPLFAGQTSFPNQTRIEGYGYQPEFQYQQTNDPNFQGSYGELNKKSPVEILKDNIRRFPELAKKHGLDKGAPTGEKVAEFQLDINNHYDSLIEDAKKQYKDNPEEFNKFKAEVDRERFTIPTGTPEEGVVTDVDAKWGNFTSTRPNFAFNVLPKDVLIEVKNAGINTASELKNMFPDYYKKYIGDRDLKSDFWLGEIQNQTPTVTPLPPVKTPINAPLNTPVNAVENKRNPMNLLLLPDQSPLRPPSMLAPSVEAPRVYSHEYMHISPNQQLNEFARAQQGIQKQIDQLPDAQRAATLASLDANNASNLSKVMSETTRYNAQADTQTAAAQAQAMTQQSGLNVAANLQNQQLMGRELEAYEADLQNYYNRLNENQINNWKYINMINRGNALNPDIQFTGNGYEVTNFPENRFRQDILPKGQEGGTHKKKKKKRF